MYQWCMHDRPCSPWLHTMLSKPGRRHSLADAEEVASTYGMLSETHLLFLMLELFTIAPAQWKNSRLMANPVAVPQTTGSKMDTAGFSKTKLGRVREEM